VAKPSTKYETSGLFVRFRYWVAKLIYDASFVILVRDGSWQEGVFEPLAPKAGDRILDFGPGSSSTAISLALRYPEATFIGADPSSKAVEKARRNVAQKELGNVSVIDTTLHGTLPFDAGSFDKAVCMLGLHDRPPEEKLLIVKEIVRVVRRGGTLHVADFDKPENRGEGRILAFARRISGPAAVAPHMNGSWTECLAKGGFTGVRRLSSYSIGIGRISVVKARKR
jgi:ubiquinone/menaquinone biosynthesis C-methylase UbiE